MVFGFTSSFRMGNILRYSLSIPDHPERLSDDEYMNTKFIDAVRKALKDHGYTRINNNEESGGVFLVGYKECLYRIDCDFQVGVHALHYDAVGCGEDYAMGAFHSMEEINDYFDIKEGITPKQRMEVALRAAVKFSAGVQEPFNFVQTEK